MSESLESTVNSLGTATLLKYLKSAQKVLEDLTVSVSELEVIDLLEQIKDLVEITSSIHELSTNRRRNYSATIGFLSTSDVMHLRPVLYDTAAITEECTVFVGALESSLKSIVQDRSSIGYTRPENQLKSQVWYRGTSEALKLRTEVLRLLSTAISLLYHKHDTDENGRLSAIASSLASTLHYQITLVDPKLHGSSSQDKIVLQSAVAAARAVTMHVPASTNKHFVVERSAKSFFTGRYKEMAKIKASIEETAHSIQKRFVIYGLGGSGKTELAIKYAEEYQNMFWGVFFVDGSSRKNAAGSYAEIAAIGGIEPNEKAAKTWLKTRDLPWLLIIDNVDDDEVSLDELLPSGTKGSILITSRNPAHKSYGNVGHRFLELCPMEEEEANELLLRAAEEPRPWSVSVTDYATTICEALGFLPLALVHAAKAILTNLCTWPGYLTYYERQVQRIRRGRFHRRDRSLSRNKQRLDEDNDGINVFSTYEILFQSLQSSQEEKFQDAVELLHIFSFLHFQNIRLDIFINAATNPYREAQAREKDSKEDEILRKRISNRKAKSWSMWFREAASGLSRWVDTPPPLPALLRNLDGLTQNLFLDEVHIRLSDAMGVLMKRSLIMKQNRVDDRYSMHPLVHEWIRERPEMLISHQSLWCQIAMTTLAKSILLPPLDDSGAGRKTRRELLPHIIHVRNCEAIIKERLEENRILRRSIWPTIRAKYGRLQAEEFARFSRVYSECGLFDEALQLQLKVRSFVAGMMGEDHILSIRLTLLVSGTLWELSRTTEATELQRRAHRICLDSLGEHHPLTLDVTDLLGSALLLKGRYTEAHLLHKKNVEEVRKLYGEHHEKYFKALRNLGRVHSRWMEYEQASALHQIAWQGMKQCLGETHLETLVCLEDLAMSYVRHDGELYAQKEEHLQKSDERMKFVHEQRKKILGKEQPYTLLAYFYWAQVKAALGEQEKAEEAERMMTEVISTAGINVSEEHTVVLAAKAHHARLLVQLGRCEEGAEILGTLIHKPQYRRTTDEDGDHPDRIAALWFLAECQEKQGKFQEALDTCEGMLVALHGIGGNGKGMNHKFRKILVSKSDELKVKIRKGP